MDSNPRNWISLSNCCQNILPCCGLVNTRRMSNTYSPTVDRNCSIFLYCEFKHLINSRHARTRKECTFEICKAIHHIKVVKFVPKIPYFILIVLTFTLLLSGCGVSQYPRRNYPRPKRNCNCPSFSQTPFHSVMLSPRRSL